MKAENLIPDEFFKQFKTGKELNNFLKSIQKRATPENARRLAGCSFRLYHSLLMIVSFPKNRTV